jgi:hypothetical protein
MADLHFITSDAERYHFPHYIGLKDYYRCPNDYAYAVPCDVSKPILHKLYGSEICHG